METTHPHKHVQIPEDQIFFGLTLPAMIISQLDKYPNIQECLTYRKNIVDE